MTILTSLLRADLNNHPRISQGYGKKPALDTPASVEDLFTDVRRLLSEAIGMYFDKICLLP